jgi:hypothetical protein
MALKKTVITRQGFNAVEAYHRVEGVHVNKNAITFQVKSYKDDSSVIHFENASFSCNYDLMGENPIKQAYQHLRTLPEFTGAFDC